MQGSMGPRDIWKREPWGINVLGGRKNWEMEQKKRDVIVAPNVTGDSFKMDNISENSVGATLWSAFI